MTEEITQLQTLIAGYESKIKEKETARDKFQRAAGLDELSEKTKKEISEIELDIEGLKEKLAEKKTEKSDALQKTAFDLSVKMNETLPRGSAIIEIDDRKVNIGWNRGCIERPYHALSGSEKIIFDGALANAFEATILWYECAEIDDENLALMLQKLLESENQVIMATWFKPVEIPRGWEVIEL